MAYAEKVAALVPAFEEDFVLLLSVPSLAPYVDEVWIHDDASRDRTPDVIERLCARFPNVRAQRGERQLGLVGATQALLDACDARHCFRLDADDVLYPGAAPALRRIAADAWPHWTFGLLECWGDFHHGRRPPNPVFDPSHKYLDRGTEEFHWVMDTGPRAYHALVPRSGAEIRRWPECLFFHACGVRDDPRIAMRSMRRQYEAGGSPCDLRDWPKFAEKDTAWIHERARRFLFRDCEIVPIPEQAVPAICRANERFEVVFDGCGRAVDRIDRGWEFSGAS